MAAHKRPDLHSIVRDRINTSKIANRLEKFIDGEVELSPAQVTAALGLLKKTLPDLASTAITGADGEDLKIATYTININGVEKK